MQSFDDVIKYLDKQKRERHLLIGNGFSMAYDHEIFSYNALSKFIENSQDDLLKKLFKTINTSNFEQIMRQLDLSKRIIEAFDGDDDIKTKIEEASSVLKKSLIEAVEKMHPEYVFSIPELKSQSCAAFLELFTKRNGKIFSTNYDILLYWVLMRNQIENAVDGFGRDAIEQDEWVPEEDMEYSELRWGKNKEKQNIYYLHGALPIFDDGIEIIKEEYDGNYILQNIEVRMNDGQYPIFVTAGDCDEKLNHILHNHYLSYCYDSLCSIKGSLITIGFNFGEYDEHIIKAINKAAKQDIRDRLRSVYIGTFSEDDVKYIESIKDKFNCKVNTFDSKTAHIWSD